MGSQLETGSPLYQKGPPLGELTPLMNDLDADASSGCWLEVEWRGELSTWPDTLVLPLSGTACHPPEPLTGLTIHFWRLLLSQALRRSLASWGRMKDWGKKLNSFLPKRLCMRDRFRHSRSLRPIWNEPGKWFSCRGTEGESRERQSHVRP